MDFLDSVSDWQSAVKHGSASCGTCFNKMLCVCGGGGAGKLLLSGKCFHRGSNLCSGGWQPYYGPYFLKGGGAWLVYTGRDACMHCQNKMCRMHYTRMHCRRADTPRLFFSNKRRPLRSLLRDRHLRLTASQGSSPENCFFAVENYGLVSR